MMKKITLTCLSLFFGIAVFAQIENPVKWSFNSKKINDKEYEVFISATLDPYWHIYAQDAGEGPEPTSIAFGKNPLITLVGKPTETGDLEKKFDKNFNSTLRFYSNKVSFVQRIRLKSKVATIVKGSVTYMVCNDKKCLPPKDLPFSVNIAGK